MELDSNFESENEIEDIPQAQLLRNQGKKSKPHVSIEYESDDQKEKNKLLN